MSKTTSQSTPRATAPAYAGQFRHAGESQDQKLTGVAPVPLRRSPNLPDSKHEFDEGDYVGESLVESLMGDPSKSLMTRSAYRSMFGQRQYRFTIVSNSALSSTGAGSFNVFQPISPNIVTYAEWSSLAALFDEVRLIQSTLYLRPCIGDNGQSLQTATSGTNLILTDIWGGTDCNNLSTAPSGFAAVLRLSDSRPIRRTVSEVDGVNALTMKARKDLGWASTGTPAVQDPPAGLLGSFNFSNSSALSVSSQYFLTVLKTSVWLRCRI